jgi:hypothetical protein
VRRSVLIDEDHGTPRGDAEAGRVEGHALNEDLVGRSLGLSSSDEKRKGGSPGKNTCEEGSA